MPTNNHPGIVLSTTMTADELRSGLNISMATSNTETATVVDHADGMARLAMSPWTARSQWPAGRLSVMLNASTVLAG